MTQAAQTAPTLPRNAQRGLQKFSHFGSNIWNRSNGRSRPQTNIIIKKALKSRIKQDKIPTSQSLSKLLKTGTHVKPSLHRTTFLLVPTNSDGRIAEKPREKSLTLNLKHKSSNLLHLPPSPTFSLGFSKVGDGYCSYFVFFHLNFQIMSIMSLILDF